MNPASSDLERLISRYLDHEATANERRELEARMREDPAVETVVRETAALDRAIGRAMQQALGRTIVHPAVRSPQIRWLQVAGFAAAASLALLVWLTPGRQPAQPPSGPSVRAGASWFAPLAPQGDVVRSVNPADERPQVRLRDTDRDWIIIPGQRPGEYLLIAVDRVRMHAIRIQGDF